MSYGGGDKKRGGESIADCLLPVEYDGVRSFKKVNFENSYPAEVRDKVKALWEKMGFDPL
jgi:phenacrylate decarboxylase